MDNKCKNTVKFIDEAFNITKFFIEMQKDFTVGRRLKLESILLFDFSVVVDFSVGDN